MGGRLILVRHGSTEYNRKVTRAGSSAERLRGWKDIPLDADGRAEAKRIAERLADSRPQWIYTSDLSRAEDTAKAIAETTGAEVSPTEKLRPWNLGTLAGKPVDEVLDQIKSLPKTPDKAAPGGESFGEFRDRYLDFLRQLLNSVRSSGKTIIAVCHTRNTQLAKAWCAEGCPKDLSYNVKVMDNYGDEVKPGHDLVLVPTTDGCKLEDGDE